MKFTIKEGAFREKVTVYRCRYEVKTKNNAGNDRSKTTKQDLQSIQQRAMLSSVSSLTRDVAYLLRTSGNRHTVQLFKAATEGQRNVASPPLKLIMQTTPTHLIHMYHGRTPPGDGADFFCLQ